jgi:hypothetical protein
MFYLLTTERRGTGQASVREAPSCVTITTENSVNKCAFAPDFYYVQMPKFGYMKLWSCRHGQPMGLKQLPGGTSSSFK